MEAAEGEATAEMTAIRVAKGTLRKELKERLQCLNKTERMVKASIVFSKVLGTTEYRESQRISIYYGKLWNDVRTDSLMDHMFQQHKTVFIPRYSETDMDMVRIDSKYDLQKLPKTSLGVKQPDLNEKRENAMDTGGLDLILMPGVGFTKEGARLGHGRGYYDSYLRKYKAKFGKLPYLIGLAHQEQICDEIPMSEFDVPLDKVLYDTDEDVPETVKEMLQHFLPEKPKVEHS